MSDRSQGLLVLDVFREHDGDNGLTTDEVCDLLGGVNHKSISSRVTELRKSGCIIELPMRRRSRLGKNRQTVYVVDKDTTDSDYQKFLNKRRSSNKDGRGESTWEQDLVLAAREYATGLGRASKVWEVIERYPGPKQLSAQQAWRTTDAKKRRSQTNKTHTP